jgi:signal transduction histidine kinase
MTMVAAMTLPVPGTRRIGDPLPTALLTDGLDGRGQRDLKVASCSVRVRDGSLDSTRAFVRRTMHAWRIDGLADDLALVVTELVTNALRHGVRPGGAAGESIPTDAGDVDVALYGTGSRVMCAVSDSSDEVPVRMAPDLARSSGRGLQIVEALSMYWGWTALERDDGSHGKSVWAVFTLDGVDGETARAV